MDVANIICWFTCCSDTFVCPCQRVGRACATCHSIGRDKSLSTTPYICLASVEKFDNCWSNEVDPIILHSSCLPEKARSANIDGNFPSADHGRTHIECVLDSISPSDF